MTILLRVWTVALGLCLALVLTEGIVRSLDGCPVFSRQLPALRAVTPRTEGPSTPVLEYVRGLPLADGVNRDWFNRSPAPLPRPPLSPELATVAEQIRPLTVS